MAALGQPAGQERVAGDEAGQEREPAEAGVTTGKQDQRGCRLDHEVHEMSGAAEDGVSLLREHRRVAGLVRYRVRDVRQPGDAADQEGDDRALGDQDLPGVAPLRRPQRADRVGYCLDTGQRGAAVGEGPRQHVDHGEAEQPGGAVPEVVRASVDSDGWQADGRLADEPDDDRQADRDGEQVGRQRERPPSLADTAQVAVAHDGDRDHRDHDQDVRADDWGVRQLRERGDDRRAASRDLHRDRDRVVDEQRDRRDLRHPWPEVLARHYVGPARPGVDGDNLPVGEHDERDAGEDDQRHRQDKRERRNADNGHELDQHLLSPVGGRGDAVGGEHAERQRLGQPLLGDLLVDQRRPEELALELVPEGLGQRGGDVGAGEFVGVGAIGELGALRRLRLVISHRGLHAKRCID